jgi:hypothetical protein
VEFLTEHGEVPQVLLELAHPPRRLGDGAVRRDHEGQRHRERVG